MAQIPEVNVPNEPITIEEAPTPEQIAESAALELVTQDAQTAETWIEKWQYTLRWTEIDTIYDPPRVWARWEGSDSTFKPRINRFTVAQHTNSLHPQIMDAIFYDTSCFMAEPRPGTEPDVVRARAALLNAELEEMEFEQEVDGGVLQMVVYGTSIYKWGLRTEEAEEIIYERQDSPLEQASSLGQPIKLNTDQSDQLNETAHKKTKVCAFFESRDLRSILVSPSLQHPDIRRAKYVIDKYYLTLDELLDLCADPAYDMPSEEELKSWFNPPDAEQAARLGNLDTGSTMPQVAAQGTPEYEHTTEDPYEQGLLVLERWDRNKVITVLNNKKVIQNRPHKYGVVPFYSANFYNKPRSFWGLGVGKMVGMDQRLKEGLTNSGLEFLQLISDPPFAVSEDANVPSQNIRFRKGGFIKVKGSVRDAIAPLEMPRMPISEIMTFLGNTNSESEAADGANDLLVQGAPSSGGKSSITRTGTGVSAFTGAVASRLQGPVGHFCKQVLIPWIYQLDTLNCRFLPLPQIRDVLGQELGEDFEIDEQKLISGRLKFSVMAGAHLAARKVMAQALPLLTQIFENPNIQQMLMETTGEYVDIKELLLMWMDATGFANRRTLIKKMTPEMEQRRQQHNAAASKAAAQSMLQAQKFSQAQALQEQKGEIGVARDLISKSMDQGGTALLRSAYEHGPDTLGEPDTGGGGV